MRLIPLRVYPLLFLLTEIDAAGIGEAWQVSPHSTDYRDQPSWPRSDSSAFEIRTVSGFGHLNPLEKAERTSKKRDIESDVVPKENRPRERNDADLAMTVRPAERVSRRRRDAENETNLEEISKKNVREARLGLADSWSAQPLSVEFPRRSLDRTMQAMDEEESTNGRGYQAPRADFVTSHHRRSYDHRESRDMPVSRGYDDYDYSWYRNGIREREYDPFAYRRGFGYYYPDRYRMERDYYARLPNDYSYYLDRYRDEELDLYGRSRPTPKPKRIIYYATLPEIVRKPVDLRNYPRPYDASRTPASRDGSYKRIPGNVDPTRYRYRQPYDSYDSYSKRASVLDRPYSYPEEESRRKPTLENLRNDDHPEQNNERKMAGHTRNEGKMPWSVQIGTEVSVKDDERISGRKIFGESNGYDRFQSAQLQKAPDATGSSELHTDN
ncbi:uncharacterized protein LOC100875712 [Megachile rotundata]|uniref:uncharacterized protein LOC100875712 n=1 Tax=Megachile rotundata TaxID=143995 RepID=UPI000258DF45|nr:PREDICTED: uncharacterized protein LOC100875712 isoform X2 [Megachile rotundata]XP_012140517.1 PREDICTED: uncharacterized protein LOC100875712 isoform X2 [Megachile rotundata]XP_012140518.1 PREDICTED: uncharacterized protein LOC100875712 isoform X2 [Megachile rotundata]